MNKENLAIQIALAIGDMEMTTFASKTNVATALLDGLLNATIDEAPAMKTLQQIAKASAEPQVTLNSLAEDAGYNEEDVRMYLAWSEETKGETKMKKNMFDVECLAVHVLDAMGDKMDIEFAKAAGLDPSTVQDILGTKLKRRPRISTLQKIALSSNNPDITLDVLAHDCGYTQEELEFYAVNGKSKSAKYNERYKTPTVSALVSEPEPTPAPAPTPVTTPAPEPAPAPIETSIAMPTASSTTLMSLCDIVAADTTFVLYSDKAAFDAADESKVAGMMRKEMVAILKPNISVKKLMATGKNTLAVLIG